MHEDHQFFGTHRREQESMQSRLYSDEGVLKSKQDIQAQEVIIEFTSLSLLILICTVALLHVSRDDSLVEFAKLTPLIILCGLSSTKMIQIFTLSRMLRQL